jgi:hypothetical protein
MHVQQNSCASTQSAKASATTQLQAAIKQHKNELHFDALHTVIAAMLQRSAAVQIAYT